jgi:hypothetical protein
MVAEPLGKRVGEGSANQIRTFEKAKWGIILTGNLRDGNARNGFFFVEGFEMRFPQRRGGRCAQGREREGHGRPDRAVARRDFS